MSPNFFLSQDKPTIFCLPQDVPLEEMQSRLRCEIRDTYHFWLEELSELEKDDFTMLDKPFHGNWAYFPWRNEAVHIPAPDDFYKVFFSRNFPIIEKDTQAKLWDMQIAIAGLSVGSNIAVELAKAGVHKFKIADFDRLGPSNNNRITGGNIFQIGENKASLLAKKLYELNPYCEIEQFPSGLTRENFNQFVHGCDIIIDEIDAFPLKNLLRDYVHSETGKNTILIQGADLGEVPIVEIEDHHDPKFGGRVTDTQLTSLFKNNPTKIESTRAFVSVVGRDNIPGSFLQNFINIKKGEQTYWSQLGIAATAVGAKIAGMVIEIARGDASKLNRLSRLSLREIPHPQEAVINHTFDQEFGYLPPIRRTIFSSDEAMLGIKRESGERTTLSLQIGNLKIKIQEIPGNIITDEELTIIHRARLSYKMWGDNLSFLLNDASDHQWIPGTAETRHLIAWIDGPNNFHKIFALRKTYLSHSQLHLLAEKNKLPLELAIWKLKNMKTGEVKNLWDAFNNSVNISKSSGTIATATRFCTISQRKNESEIEKEAAAMTFAAMQLFTSDTTSPDFICNILTPKSIKKIFSIIRKKQKNIPAFNHAPNSLGLTSSWKTTIDKNNPMYDFYASKVPKYWAQNPSTYVTKVDEWRKSALAVLAAAKEKYN